MSGNWLVRSVIMVLAAITLSGCIVVPARPYHPYYYYR